MRPPAIILSVLLIWSGVCPAIAQRPASAVITGTVLDAETGLPLEDAHVFISESMVGTSTSSSGTFRLPRVRAAQYRIVASMLGYQSAFVDTMLRGGDEYRLLFELHPSVHVLEELHVSTERPRRWVRRLRTFDRLFIGESDHAKETRLLNAEVLDFDGGWGRLRAFASAPLEIENRALGYHVRFVLREFERSGATIRYDGDPFFQELVPESEQQAEQWSVNRCQAFFGSFRHFMLTLLNGTSREAGYRLARRARLELGPREPSFRTSPDRLVHEGTDPDFKLLRFGGFLDVTYTRKEEEDAFIRWYYRGGRPMPSLQRSWLKLGRRETLVDLDGEPVDPYGITVYGYFAFLRVANQLPKEYRPPAGVSDPAECAQHLMTRSASAE